MNCAECGKPLETPEEEARQVCTICHLLREYEAESRPSDGPDGGDREEPPGPGEGRPDEGDA